MKIGLFGLFYCSKFYTKQSTRVCYISVIIAFGVVTLFFLSVLGGRLFSAALLVQAFVVLGISQAKRPSIFRQSTIVFGLAVVVFGFGIYRYAASISHAQGIEVSEASRRVLGDRESIDRILFDNFFDTWFTVSAVIWANNVGASPKYGLYHFTSATKAVPGLYNEVKTFTRVDDFRDLADLGLRTIPYAAEVYVDFSWFGVLMFLLLGLVVSSALRGLFLRANNNGGFDRLLILYAYSTVVILTLYLFRSGITVAFSWGIGEFLSIILFYCALVTRSQIR